MRRLECLLWNLECGVTYLNNEHSLTLTEYLSRVEPLLKKSELESYEVSLFEHA